MERIKQKQAVLNWLRNEGPLTFREAVYKMNIMDVRKRIQELRDEGYTIRTDWVYLKSGKKYGVYTLIEEED